MESKYVSMLREATSTIYRSVKCYVLFQEKYLLVHKSFLKFKRQSSVTNENQNVILLYF
jgi:hypothetical protein